MRFSTRRVRGVMLTLAGTLLLAGACNAVDDLLKVENPEQLKQDNLNDAQLVDILVNSAVGEFVNAYDDPFIWQGSMFTDEQVTGINWEQTARLNQRIVRYDEGPPDDMFSALSRARTMADSASAKLQALLDDPNNDARLARTLNYAGYSFILLGDAMCEATVGGGADILSPTDLYGMAVQRFEQALQVAQNAGDADLENLALVGLTRAHLNMGDFADAMTYADQVPSDFVWWAEYDDDSRVSLVLQSRVTGGNHALGVHPRFLDGVYGETIPAASQTDPRIQYYEEGRTGHNALSILYTPYNSLPYSDFVDVPQSEGGEPILYERGTDIKMADYLEAVHDYYEAAIRAAGAFDADAITGPEGTLREFVDARRAFGRKAAFTATATDEVAWRTELKEQRARDLYMGGFRLGDLRRWLRWGEEDALQVFPSGPHPVTQWGNYGDATCFPIPIEEYQGNPNIQDPH